MCPAVQQIVYETITYSDSPPDYGPKKIDFLGFTRMALACWASNFVSSHPHIQPYPTLQCERLIIVSMLLSSVLAFSGLQPQSVRALAEEPFLVFTLSIGCTNINCSRNIFIQLERADWRPCNSNKEAHQLV